MNDLARAQIFDKCPDVKMYLKSDAVNPLGIPSREKEIDLISVDVDTEGQYVVAHTDDNEQYFVEDLIVEKNFLPVPGVGYLRPGTKVRLEGDPTEYVLLFGWHTNISNQTIYSWYLRPIKEFIEDNSDNEYMSQPIKELSDDKTLYYEMINKIWRIGVGE